MYFCNNIATGFYHLQNSYYSHLSLSITVQFELSYIDILHCKVCTVKHNIFPWQCQLEKWADINTAVHSCTIMISNIGSRCTARNNSPRRSHESCVDKSGHNGSPWSRPATHASLQARCLHNAMMNYTLHTPTVSLIAKKLCWIHNHRLVQCSCTACHHFISYCSLQDV